MNKKILIYTLIIYVASSVASYGLFSYFSKSDVGKSMLVSKDKAGDQKDADGTTKLTALLQIDPSETKDQPCPLKGKYFTKYEKEAWEKKRPLAVMIENSVDARPQSGMSDADIIFEALAEGGVTRYMGLFYCGVQKFDTVLAPVRSARTYFIDWASGFNLPMYVHVGGANIPGPADALGQISNYGWALETDLNQFSIGYPTFVRNANRLDREVATEHTMETTTELLWKVATKRKWTNLAPERKIGKKTIGGDDWKDGYTPWKFQDQVDEVGQVNNFKYKFWDTYGDYAVEWNYNKETNTYKRNLGGKQDIDLNNNKRIEASNVIVILTTEKGPIDELKHILYTTIGKGNAIIFKNGQEIKGTWVKKDRESQLQFFDRKGNELELARGLIWISVLDTTAEVTY